MSEDHLVKRGLVKQVLSGDSVVLQGPATNGPPKEITIYLSNVAAPRLAKRPVEGGSEGSNDEPYAWEAREFIRKKIVGKTVVFIRDFLATSGREHGRIYLGGTSPDDAENIAESAVLAGWLEVKQGKQVDEHTEKLLAAQEKAKSSKLGRWAEDGNSQAHVRDIIWQVEDLRELVDNNKGKAFDAVVEQVRDGSTLRVFLLPDFQYLTVMISGIKAPAAKVGQNGRNEPYGEEAKFFVESRILQRDVKIYLEGVSNQNVVGSVIHPRGNIAELLVEDGYARCVEWTLNLVTEGPQKYREAEKRAKAAKLRIWANYVSTALPASQRKTSNVKVIEVGLGDNITVLKDNGEEEKVFFSSLKGVPRPGTAKRPLYDTPWMFEAREFLRKRLIGKKVQLTLDYIQPQQEKFPEKHCYSVIYNGQNIAEKLIEEGLAKVLRHKQDDENRSVHYDDLLAAESNAEKEKKGIWNQKETGLIRVNEIQNDLARAKTYLSTFQRGSRPSGIVEFVSSGSRLRVYIPKENAVITVVLSGISCPRTARLIQGKPQGESEPFGEEAYNFTRRNVLQREVHLDIDSIDKSGGFIGFVFYQGESGQVNLAEQLVEQGLASVHFTAEKTKYYNQLLNAEKRAQDQKLRLWKDYVEHAATESSAQVEANDVSERKLNLKKVLVSEVAKGNLHFFIQQYEDGPIIEKLMADLQREVGTPTTSYTPRKNELCAGFFKEINLWHRVKVESIKGGNADIVYVDFGNRETVPTSLLAPLPTSLVSQQPLAKEYKLALVQPPNDADFAAETDAAFQDITRSVEYVEMNPEYRIGTLQAVTLYFPGQDNKSVDLGKYLVEQGLALTEHRREPRFQKLVKEYEEAEATARRERRNIWRYGDFTGQDV
ncbi:unnamed protein product [Bursaphelenchus okinawaensis]|uniref:Micrococcal nuclease n=1 Tax=Bursaphelenchus okinawaensis TaxID=465554 RepID=A0A811K7H6_9BILA|nr:unnamed protein product [Bursaphelenchus okinawaensis]CAG9094074.1 unnamed protein product [Bursaphelenchus okinawaensis]